jgi:hypothetical protein
MLPSMSDRASIVCILMLALSLASGAVVASETPIGPDYSPSHASRLQTPNPPFSLRGDLRREAARCQPDGYACGCDPKSPAPCAYCCPGLKCISVVGGTFACHRLR